jgi:hypothetical protein
VAGRASLSECAVIGVASKSRITCAGAAPAAQARALACARAARRRSSSASPIDSSTRRAVETDATAPNSAGCEPRATRSDTQRPPSASITARSQNTRPGSCAERRSRVSPSAQPSASVSPSRSAASGNSAVPARDDNPVPSARTSTFWMPERPITFKVRLLSGREGSRQPQLSLLRRTFQPARRSPDSRANDESRPSASSETERPTTRPHPAPALKGTGHRGERWAQRQCAPAGPDVLTGLKTVATHATRM